MSLSVRAGRGVRSGGSRAIAFVELVAHVGVAVIGARIRIDNEQPTAVSDGEHSEVRMLVRRPAPHLQPCDETAPGGASDPAADIVTFGLSLVWLDGGALVYVVGALVEGIAPLATSARAANRKCKGGRAF